MRVNGRWYTRGEPFDMDVEDIKRHHEAGWRFKYIDAPAPEFTAFSIDDYQSQRYGVPAGLLLDDGEEDETDIDEAAADGSAEATAAPDPPVGASRWRSRRAQQLVDGDDETDG